MTASTLIPCACAALMLGAMQAPAELTAHWRFDEGAGTTYADSSEAGNDAYPPGTGTWSSSTPPTGFANPHSLQFDGTDDYISSAFAGIGGDAPRTVAFWINTTAASSANFGIVAWGDSATNGAKWHIRLNSSAANGPLSAIRTETQGDFTIGTTPLNDGQWHHVASVYPGGGELGTVLHYVDGALDAQGGDNASIQAVNTTTTADPVTVGRRTQGAAQNYYPGLIDDVRIYDRALSAAEIVALPGVAPTADGLILHYAFDEGTGESTADTGSGGNPGTLNGTTVLLPTWSADAPPHLATSLQFAGGGDLLHSDYPGIAGSASRSLTFWFKTTSSVDNGILAWGNSNADGLKWHARINSTAADGPVGALRLEIQGGRAVATTPVADGEWHHAAIVFEEDADPDVTDIVFYLDGQDDAIAQSLSVPINTQTSGAGVSPLTIGGRFQVAAMRPFIGNLADVRIYDHGLTAAEVAEIMAGGGAGPTGIEITDVSFDTATRNASVTWRSRPGQNFLIETTSSLEGPWGEVDDSYPAGPGETTTYDEVAIPESADRMFFRISSGL